jgi:hypothetical protein
MPFAEKWLLCVSVSMCLFALGVMHITSERTNQIRNNSLRKEFPMALYGIIAAVVVIIVAIPNEGLACISNVCYGYSLWRSGCSRYKTSSTSSTIQNVIRIHEFMNGKVGVTVNTAIPTSYLKYNSRRQMPCYCWKSR